MARPVEGKQLGVDPLDRATPGQSLTSAPKDWAWEKPPQILSPKDATNMIISRLNEPEYHNQMMDMLYAGVTIESLVKVLTFTGFMNGLWTPDVAEATKVPVFFWIMAQAAKAGLRPRLYNNLKDTEVNKGRIMKRLDPTKYKELTAETPEAPAEELPAEEPQEITTEPFMTMEE